MVFPSTRIATRLIVAFAIPTALVVGASSILAYLITQQAFREQYQRRLEVLATTIASQISPDRVLSLLPGDEQSSWYLGLSDELQKLKSAADLKSLYLIDGQGRIYVDADRLYAIEQRIRSWPSDADAVLRATRGGSDTWVIDESGDEPRYRAYQRLLVARALGMELTGSEREEILILGIETRLHYIPALRTVAWSLMLLGGFALLAVVAIALIVARTITKPIALLVDDAQRIGSGDLSAPMHLNGSDEVAFLAKTLDEMRDALAHRDRDRQAMLAGIAHEVRNPLGGMELFMGLLHEGIAELEDVNDVQARQQLSEYAQRVIRELGYLEGVVNDFLAFARESPLSLHAVDVGELFENVKQLVDNELALKQVQLEIDDSQHICMQADEGALRRAVLNLVQNAIQATPRDGKVRLCAHRRSNAVQLIVEDTGMGIEADRLQEILQPFVTTKEKGTGLGLAIVNKVVRGHGGRLQVHSTVGQGTRIVIEIGEEVPEPKAK